MKNILKTTLKITVILGALMGCFYANAAFADVSNISLSQVGTNIQDSVSTIAKILLDIAIIAGIGFVMASFFKFHQHKLNPTQIPLSQGLTLLLIGAGLLLFPTILQLSTTTVFGSQAKIAHVDGNDITSLIGGTN